MVFQINGLLLLLGLALIALVQIYAFMKMSKRITAQHARLSSLSSEIQALLFCSRGVGEQLHDQKEQFRDIQDRQEALELNEGNHPLPYKQIMAMMGSGMNEHEVMDQCDLTQGELELMRHLKKNPNIMAAGAKSHQPSAWN